MQKIIDGELDSYILSKCEVIQQSTSEVPVSTRILVEIVSNICACALNLSYFEISVQFGYPYPVLGTSILGATANQCCHLRLSVYVRVRSASREPAAGLTFCD
jgi:hypothetical protein